MSEVVPSVHVYPNSLGDTLDAVNAALFDGGEIPTAARAEAAAWIADRQGLPGAYAGMFAPTEYDYAFGTLTFTGEPVQSAAATGHVLSEESCRALLLLGVDTPAVVSAIYNAREGIFHRLEQSEVDGKWSGVYCCGQCSVSLWRHLSASEDGGDLRRLENGLSALKHHRDGAGRWRRFPFYYTLLALSGINLPGVREEVTYAGPVIERALRRLEKGDPLEQNKHDQRRRVVLERIAEKWL